jgi:S-adenosylmethionine hydrolase
MPSPSAAHLAAGEEWTLAGPTVDTLVRLTPATATNDAKGITGQVIGLDDAFGSLITGIQGDDFKKLDYSLGEKVPVKINFSRVYKIAPPVSVFIARKKE